MDVSLGKFGRLPRQVRHRLCTKANDQGHHGYNSGEEYSRQSRVEDEADSEGSHEVADRLYEQPYFLRCSKLDGLHVGH